MTSETIDIEVFLEQRERLPVIDVRAPIEFQQGHIAGACNVPLLDDDERARVGTIYKNRGRREAVRVGLDLIGPKMRKIVEQVDRICQESGRQPGETGRTAGEVMVYCARGGMRSDSVCWLLGQADFRTYRLQGGYKGYRHYCHQWLEKKWDLIALTGMTGAGKTRLLHELADAGEQIIDLEGLAHHRGSAFGGIGQPDQPTTEEFENRIFETLHRLDPARRIWVEDESRSVGKCVVPPAFFAQLHAAPALLVDVNVSERADFLVGEYGDLPHDQMIAAIERIGKRLGGQHVQAAIQTLHAGDLRRCAEILLVYYDKTYNNCRIKNPRERVIEIPLSGCDRDERVQRVLRTADQLVSEVR